MGTYSVILPATMVFNSYSNYTNYNIYDSTGADVTQWFQIEDASKGWADVRLLGPNVGNSDAVGGARTQYYDHSTGIYWNNVGNDPSIGYSNNGWGGNIKERKCIYIKKCLDPSKVASGTFTLKWSGEVQTLGSQGFTWKRNFNVNQKVNFDFSEQEISPGKIEKGEVVNGFYYQFIRAYDVFATPKKLYIRFSSAHHGTNIPKITSSNHTISIGGVIRTRWRVTSWANNSKNYNHSQPMVAFGHDVYETKNYNVPSDVGDIAVHLDVDSYFKNPAKIYFNRAVGPVLPAEPPCAGTWDSATGMTVWNSVAYSAYTYGSPQNLTETTYYNAPYEKATVTINDNSKVENIDTSLLMNVLEGLFAAQSGMKGYKYYLIAGAKTASTFEIYGTDTLVLIRYFEYTHSNMSTPQRIIAFGFCGTSETGPRLPGIIFSNAVNTPPSGQPVITPGSGSTQVPTNIQSTTSNAGVAPQPTSYIFRLITFT